ncbi:MAG: DUF3795 domain-containing protein [Lachnospiraceae bacterium]|nr:DUF3795 domain-containing protein [Lachnospiraceae bacterium]
MEYKQRSYPLFAACGLNCGLCPRYYTKGSSRCPGCAGEGFSDVHPACGVLSCCQRKGLEYCFLCNEYPCKRYQDDNNPDSFITHRNQFADMDKAKRIGMPAYEAELNSKVKVLEQLLSEYDDGRRKSFYCLAINLLELVDINLIMEKLATSIGHDDPIKNKAKIAVNLFQNVADEKGIYLKLCKTREK